MAIAWFICPYKRKQGAARPTRYCAMDDFTAQIFGEGGKWSETEILGNRAIVKVRASDALLNTIAAAPTFRRIPLAALDNSLSSLTVGQRTAIRNELLDAGYTLDEVNTRFPDLAVVTLRQVLRFMASRRLKPRYDQPTDSIVCDGAVQNCRAVESVDGDVI